MKEIKEQAKRTERLATFSHKICNWIMLLSDIVRVVVNFLLLHYYYISFSESKQDILVVLPVTQIVPEVILWNRKWNFYHRKWLLWLIYVFLML